MIDVLFIYPPYKKRAGGGTIFPLGIGYLISAIQKNGYSFDYMDAQELYDEDSYTFRCNLVKALCKNNYRLIAISCVTTAAVPYLNDLTNACKFAHKNTPLIMGGQLVSIDYVAKLFIKKYEIDAICRGDGDYVLPMLVDHIRLEKPLESFPFITTSDRISEKCYVNNVDSLDFPYRDKKIVDKTKLSFGRSTYHDKTLTMITSRGCFYKCRYCVSGCNTRRFQKRSWENIVSEIKHIQDTYNVYSIVFYDDCFFFNKKTVNEDVVTFITEQKRQGCKPFKWQMEIRADIIAAISPDSWRLLYGNGCMQVNVGIEAFDDATLDYLGKNINTNTIKKAIALLHDAAPQIIITATFIIGPHNSDRESILNIARTAQELNIMYIRLYPLELHPGTILYEKSYGKSDDWYEFIVNNNKSYSCMYFENDTDELRRIDSDIQDAYKIFYCNGYWEKIAKMMYQDNYNEIRNRLINTYGLEE